MSRRSKKNPNQNFTQHNPYPGSNWEYTSSASVYNDWNNLGESFWGGNNHNIRQNKRGNDQSRPPDRGRNKPTGPEKSSSATQEKYPWSTLKVKTSSENDNETTATTGHLNGTISSANSKWDGGPSSPLNDSIFKELKNTRREQNKQLMMGLSKPVECSIAERMMQKMGWQGGGLGVKEEGRTEPIDINLNFINKTTGLGHNDKKQKQQKLPPAKQKLAYQKNLKLPLVPVLYLQPVTLDLNEKQTKKIEKKNKKVKNDNEIQTKKEKKKGRRNQHETIDIDVLDTILDFVMDVKQIEFGFDLNYSKKERRIIHNFVEYLRDGFNEEVIFDFDDSHLGKIDEINEYNNYILVTESQGAHPNRQLFIYKEAPDGVYLVTRDDLIEKKDENDEEAFNDDEQKNNKLDNIVEKEADIKKTAKIINKTPDLIKETKASAVKTDTNVDLEEQSIKATNNTIVQSILTDLVENIPNSSESYISNNKKVNKSDNDDLKEDTIKNKHTVADFIKNCINDIITDVETHILDTTNINKTDILENNPKTPEIDLNSTQDNKLEEIPKSKDANEINDEVIEIDLTDSEDTEVKTLIKSPKIQESNSEISEINGDVKENNTENDMDVELEKIRGLPKLEHFETALYIYLKDFLKHDVYTEMRFLGDFGDAEDEEQVLLSRLLNNICEVSYRSKNYDDLAKAANIYKELYDNETYYLQLGKDCNGGEVIYKVLRCWEEAED